MASRWHPSECVYCGARAEDGHHISARGMCESCGDQRAVDCVEQLRAGTGPHWEHWRRRLLASFGVGVFREHA